MLSKNTPLFYHRFVVVYTKKMCIFFFFLYTFDRVNVNSSIEIISSQLFGMSLSQLQSLNVTALTNMSNKDDIEMRLFDG